MRKLMYLLAIAVVATVAASCGGGAKTPKDVAEKSVECLKNGDYNGYSKLVYYNDTLSSDELKAQQETTAALLKGKYEESVKKKGKITGYQVVSEEVNDSNAVVKMRIGYEKADSTNESVRLHLAKDGNWRISMGK